MKYLTNRAYGKARQAIEHAGDSDAPLEVRIIRVGAKSE